jgi:uncharacterized protein YegL
MICGLALVLMLDMSGSVNGEAWALQVEAHADALADPAIGRAMSQQGISAVSVIAYDDAPRVMVPWRIVDAPEDAATVAREVAAIQRPSNGATHTGRAIAFALDHLERAPCVADRQIVDVVTDGPGDDAHRLRDARERAITQDVRINVLTVNTYPTDAAGWAREELVTPGGFVMEAESWREFAWALRRKISSEVSQR